MMLLNSATQYASKVAAIVGGRYGEWVPMASWAIEDTGDLRFACLVLTIEYAGYRLPDAVGFGWKRQAIFFGASCPSACGPRVIVMAAPM